MTNPVQIGLATLYLGDAREIVPSIWGGGGSVVTDPPYGMSFRSNHREEQHDSIANDDTDELLQWACRLQPSHSSYIFCRWDNLFSVPKPKSVVTWVKNNWSMGDLEHEHARQTELILFYPGSEHDFPLSRPTDMIRAPRTINEHHPTEKPVALFEYLIRTYTDEGMTVLDNCAGSGTTAIAADRSGRQWVCIERDPEYFSKACERVENEKQGLFA